MTHHFTTANPKTSKSVEKGWMTIILHLKPGSGWICPYASRGCRAACLNTSGRGQCPSVQNARTRRTRAYLKDQAKFAFELMDEVCYYARRAQKKGLKLAVRINGTSDRASLAEDVARGVYRRTFGHTGTIRFYDYTKEPPFLQMEYGLVHKTFSRTESNETDCMHALNKGMNVAVVFSTKKGEPLPKLHRIGRLICPVIDGDESDLRFLDPTVRVVGLRAKGKARKDTTGFVVQV